MPKRPLSLAALTFLLFACNADEPRPDEATSDGGVPSEAGGDAGTSDERRALEPFLEVAGDGSNAYRKLADVYCERKEACWASLQMPREWADHATCVDLTVGGMSVSNVDVSCDGTGDVTITPLSLARCLKTLSEANCLRVPDYAYQALLRLVVDGRLGGCADASAEAVAAENAMKRLQPVGAACESERECGFHEYCDKPEGAACGVCRTYPRAGERCMVDYEGELHCDLGYTCNSDGRCAPLEGGDGERCAGGDTCIQGLECSGLTRSSHGTCVQVHREGDACKEQADCGPWFRCVDGSCQLFEQHGAVGHPCEGKGDCPIGVCLKGRCTEAPSAGEPCAKECPDCKPRCLAPSVCVDGMCVDAPSCGLEEGDACSASGACAIGFGCFHESAVCEPVRSDLGELCTKEGDCEQGDCRANVCVLLEGGASCSRDAQCASEKCDAGQCAAAECR